MKRLKNQIYKALFIVSGVIFLLNCSACKVEQEKEKITNMSINSKPNLTSPLQFSFASGGGITGLKKGYTLFTDGKVNFWQQLSFVKDTVIWNVVVDTSEVNNFRNELLKSGLMEKEYTTTGNMTTYLKFETSDTTYNWSWIGKGSNENTPLEIKNWFKEVSDYCSTLNK